jgi:signal transduction histidine kinase
VLPELDDLRLNGVVELAARAHENRTATRVEQKISTSVPFAPRELKTCVFRFVQEALNNAFKHAGGQGQRVTLDVEGRTITVTVNDSGCGVSQSASPAETGRLGLSGIRDRVEAIGGTFSMRSSDASGTTLIAVFDLDTLNPSGGSHE